MYTVPPIPEFSAGAVSASLRRQPPPPLRPEAGARAADYRDVSAPPQRRPPLRPEASTFVPEYHGAPALGSVSVGNSAVSVSEQMLAKSMERECRSI